MQEHKHMASSRWQCSRGADGDDRVSSDPALGRDAFSLFYKISPASSLLMVIFLSVFPLLSTPKLHVHPAPRASHKANFEEHQDRAAPFTWLTRPHTNSSHCCRILIATSSSLLFWF